LDPRLADYLSGLGVATNALDGWTVHTAQRAGVDVGFVAIKGPEIHILPIVARKALSRKNITAYLKPLLDEHGYVTTRVPVADTNHRLRINLGFELTWSDERFTYWALTALPFERNTS
jgi:hypothetical protein